MALFRAAQDFHLPSGGESSIAAIGNLLDQATTELGTIELTNLDFETLLQGAMRSYRKGRRRLHVVAMHPTSQGLHALRKRAKDQLYQLRLFALLEPEVIGMQLKQIERLSEQLGAHHDLVLLQDAIALARSSSWQFEELPGLAAWTSARMAELETDALALAQACHAESAKTRARQLRGLFRQCTARLS